MILLYCMTEPNVEVTAAATGVRGGAVTSLTEEGSTGGLRCFYSDSDLTNTSQHTNQIAVDAMEFDAVIRGIFKDVAVIPFRFMTAMGTLEELRGFLKQNADEYAAELARIRSKTQMEVRITAKQAPRPAGEGLSGTEFLKSKQENSQAVEEAAEKFIATCPNAEWKRRPSPDGSRLYALIEREALAGAENFSQAAAKVDVGPEFNVRISGPWPATEFINCYAELQKSVASASAKK